MTRTIPFVVAIALGVSACAQVEDEPRAPVSLDTERQCFFTRQIRGYADAPDGPRGQQRFTVDTGPNDDWMFEVLAGCQDLDFSYRIALDTGTQTSLCTGDTVNLIVPRGLSGPPDRCMARLIGKVVEEE